MQGSDGIMNEKTYRILIVEDDKSISDLLCMNLSVAGYHCDAAEDGKQAVQMIHGSSYDLAILDIMLPEIDGFALYEHMSTKGIPVIYLSAKTGYRLYASRRNTDPPIPPGAAAPLRIPCWGALRA